MSHPWPKKLAMLLVLVPVLLAQGCPDSAIIQNLIGSLTVVSAASPNDTGRWDTAILTINQIELMPVDPGASESLGGTNLGVLFDPVPVPLDLLETSVGATELTAGQYEVVSVILQSFLLEDTTLPNPPTDCLDLFDVLAQSFTPPIAYGDFDPPVIITIPQDSLGTVNITIDSPGLIEMLESHFVCSLFNPCFNPPSPPPCIAGFVPVTADDLRPFITVE